MILVGFMIAAFFCGSLPTAFIVAKKIKGIDIRHHGSGNVGATNAFRVLGKGPGSFVFAVDFLKGFLPVWFFSNSSANAFSCAPLLVGVFAILGHIFTPFLGFRGGKGVATGSGVLAGSHPVLFALSFLSWVLIFICTKIVSISSILAVIVLSVSAWVMAPGEASTFLLSALSAFVLWTHRANISRLLRGEEKPVGKSNK